MNKTKNTNKWFTLIEVLVGIFIVSMVFIAWFQAWSAVTYWKVKLIQATDMQKESFYFSERLFEMIKKWGLIDYEEYFNRKVRNNSWGWNFNEWHFAKATWFWNFWNWGTIGTSSFWNQFYNCISWDSLPMWTDGCVTSHNTPLVDYRGKLQRYGQYSFQFIDYNWNHDWDGWNEDGGASIIWDDDDEYLGEGPEVFANGTDAVELYLISWDKKRRTYFRWKWVDDPDAPDWWTSCGATGSANKFTWTCRGTIEYLKLSGKDWGMDHNEATSDPTQYDGVIDTWLIDKDFAWAEKKIAGSDNNNYWVPLFPDTINISEFAIYAFPNKDRKLAWKDDSPAVNVAPYLRIQYSVLPAWKTRKMIKWQVKQLDFSTTISLTDIFSK